MDLFNNTNPLAQLGFSAGSKKNQRPTNFIEALKDIGSSGKQQTKDLIFGAPGNKQPSAGETGKEAFNFEEYLKSREKQIALQERQRFESKIEQERLIFHRKQEETKLQIQAIQEELKKLAQTTSNLSGEVKKATLQAVVEPGTYHENFFDRIRKLIELARKKLAESETWMQIFNARSKQKSHYWGQVQKSGTQFMLSQERYMVTQVG